MKYPYAIKPMPVDRCGITTDIQINSDAVDVTKAFGDRVGIWIDRRGDHEQNYDPDKAMSTNIELHRFGALCLFCRRSRDSPRWHIKSIQINPSKILYGHNACAIDQDDFYLAMTIARDLMRPVLANPDDVIHIVPGVDPQGIAYWNSLEIRLDLHDRGGHLWRAFRNSRCPDLKKTPCRHDEESMRQGNMRSALAISIYRKDLEREKLLKLFGVGDVLPTLRIEVILKGAKLLAKLRRPGNTAQIAGKARLVRFCGLDLVRTHQEIMHRQQGCYESRHTTADHPMDEKFGRVLGMLAAVYNFPLDDALTKSRERFGISDATYYRQRKAALDEHAATSTLSPAEVFSLKAYLYPASISIPALEHGLYALRNSYSVDHRIAEAYRAPAGMEPRFDVIHSEDQLRKMVAMYEEKEPVDRASLRRAFMGE